LYSNDDSESTQPAPSKKKTQQVKKVTPSLKVISSQGKDDSLQARRSLSHQAEDANDDSILDRSLQKRLNLAQEVKKTNRGNRDRHSLLLQTRKNKTQLVEGISKASDDASAKPQQVKRASKTQGNDIPQAAEEAPRRPVPNVPKSENSRTTANNPVSIAKASKPPAPKKKSSPKLKPDSIAITTANGSISGDDEDQKEREEMLASPVKGSDARTASTVSQITLFDCIFTLSLCKALVKLEKTNEKPKNRSKAELLQLEKKDLITWNNILEPNYVKYYLSTKTLWSADAKLLEVAQLLYNETLGSKRPLTLTPSSGPIKLVAHPLLFIRMSLTFS
jgi:hypothetical protein